jgi:peroxiredoxin
MTSKLTTGQPAPLFTLNDLNGQAVSLADLRGRILLLNFWSAECPWSERTDRSLADLTQAWGEQVAVWTIAANANEPLEQIQAVASERGLAQVLLDPNQRVTDLYGAQTTPHIFIVDAMGKLAYQGAPDDVTFQQRTPTRSFVQEAVQALLEGRSPDPAETLAYGCAVVRAF